MMIVWCDTVRLVRAFVAVFTMVKFKDAATPRRDISDVDEHWSMEEINTLSEGLKAYINDAGTKWKNGDCEGKVVFPATVPHRGVFTKLLSARLPPLPVRSLPPSSSHPPARVQTALARSLRAWSSTQISPSFSSYLGSIIEGDKGVKMHLASRGFAVESLGPDADAFVRTAAIALLHASVQLEHVPAGSLSKEVLEDCFVDELCKPSAELDATICNELSDGRIRLRAFMFPIPEGTISREGNAVVSFWRRDRSDRSLSL